MIKSYIQENPGSKSLVSAMLLLLLAIEQFTNTKYVHQVPTLLLSRRRFGAKLFSRQNCVLNTTSQPAGAVQCSVGCLEMILAWLLRVVGLGVTTLTSLSSPHTKNILGTDLQLSNSNCCCLLLHILHFWTKFGSILKHSTLK